MSRLSLTLMAGGAFVLACTAGAYGGSWAARRYARSRRAHPASSGARSRRLGQRGPGHGAKAFAMSGEDPAAQYEQAASWARQAMFGSA